MSQKYFTQGFSVRLNFLHVKSVGMQLAMHTKSSTRRAPHDRARQELHDKHDRTYKFPVRSQNRRSENKISVGRRGVVFKIDYTLHPHSVGEGSRSSEGSFVF